MTKPLPTGTDDVREALVEKYLLLRLRWLALNGYRSTVKKIGGPGWRGWPDRMALFDGGCAHWLEVKRPKGGRFEPLQLRCHRKLRDIGFVVRVVNTREAVDAYIKEVLGCEPWGVAP